MASPDDSDMVLGLKDLFVTLPLLTFTLSGHCVCIFVCVLVFVCVLCLHILCVCEYICLYIYACVCVCVRGL